MSTIKIGDKLTSDCGGTGLIGEMVVTKIVAADPDLDVFGAGDLVYVTETLNDNGTIHRYDTFFNASKLVDGVLTFNEWQWTVATPKVTIQNIDTRPDLDVYRRDTNGETYTELTIYPTERIVDVTQEGRSNSQSMAEFHRLVLSAKIDGHPDETTLREYLESDEGQALMDRVCAGHDRDWDGHNWIGTLTDDAQDAWDTLIAELEDMPATDWQFWPIDDWASVWADENITADMTDEQVAAKATELDALAESECVNLAGSTIDYLTGIRNDKRDEDE